jgi:trans-aconitate methyltransferase
MTKDTRSFSRISPYYSDLISKYGHDAKACDYGRQESQQIKFRVLSEVAQLDGRSILDVGCGFADYSDFLKNKGINTSYTGLDLTPAMVQHARLRHPNLEIICGNILDFSSPKEFDIVSANGIFYLIDDDPWVKMQDIIRQMFTLCTQALTFNSLSLWAEEKTENEFYADPLKTIEFCKKLTSRLTFRHDYHGRDFTMYLYK